MNPAWYQALIEDLCAQNGGCTASEVQACRHLQVQGRLVGLIPGEDGSLHVFIELGPSHPECDGPLYQRLLAFNTGRPEEMSGWFGLHPQGHSVAYCLRLPQGTTARELAELLPGQMQLAQEAFASLTAAA